MLNSFLPYSDFRGGIASRLRPVGCKKVDNGGRWEDGYGRRVNTIGFLPATT